MSLEIGTDAPPVRSCLRDSAEKIGENRSPHDNPKTMWDFSNWSPAYSTQQKLWRRNVYVFYITQNM